MGPCGQLKISGALLSHLIGVFYGEVLDWGDDALCDQLTVRRRGLLLDELRLVAVDWRKHAVRG